MTFAHDAYPWFVEAHEQRIGPAKAVGESRVAIGAIGVMVNIDADRADAFASKPAPTLNLCHDEDQCGSGLAREEALKA
ncbi:hypothetical protein C5612_15850 [Pseudomonas frederiksbergensis]|uniref:Uncharacterized protein n=1 Tax=Pseudomonas frederiksbergensis TaxID=104087 RepID=A0A2S8HLB0_9PSED|nr:hypothetical protein C5612_15850 [Pseudomonas frederiksbergensis]